ILAAQIHLGTDVVTHVEVAQHVPSHILLTSSYPTHMVHVPAHGPGPDGPGPIAEVEPMARELRRNHHPHTRVNKDGFCSVQKRGLRCFAHPSTMAS